MNKTQSMTETSEWIFLSVIHKLEEKSVKMRSGSALVVVFLFACSVKVRTVTFYN